MLSFILTLILVLVFQPRFIAWFKKKQLSQPIRTDGPETHLVKAGTPTMGGLVIVAAVLLSTLCFASLTNLYVWVVVGVTAGYAALGFVDDFRKVQVGNSVGVRAKTKLFWQILIAATAVGVLMMLGGDFSTKLHLPFFKNVTIELGWFYLPFAALVIVGCSNAVNLTDGLDGLVIGPIMTVASAYGVFAYTSAGAGDLAIFAAAIVAGGLAFLWFNSFPAQVFMGDVGALGLGGALGVLAVITKQEILLVIAGGVFVSEALSVILQVTSFKLTGKRVLRMA
ncbi:UNVERIFIED_CONTAM: hypothetical protein GTU68_019955, partial [Idotea baltica]|nr:hypothetical protein [Idotea baltica]